MLILVDQSAPLPIRAFLEEHTVETVWQRRWDKLRDSELLRIAEDAAFEVFLTADKNIAHQQNSKISSLAVVVLDNVQWSAVRRHIDRVITALNAAKPGTYVEVEIPQR